MDNNELKINKKCQRNKISFLLIRFFAGLCDITDIGVKYYYKDIKELDTTTLTKILLVFKIPYLVKPIYGLLIDFVPIFGYKKKYIYFYALLSIYYLGIYLYLQKILVYILLYFVSFL
jgi:hypothetical protein